MTKTFEKLLKHLFQQHFLPFLKYLSLTMISVSGLSKTDSKVRILKQFQGLHYNSPPRRKMIESEHIKTEGLLLLVSKNPLHTSNSNILESFCSLVKCFI